VDIYGIAAALGGEICGGQVLCPGPGHGPRDRSLSVKLSASSPVGFIAFSHSGDDWRECSRYVCEKLGIESHRDGRSIADHDAKGGGEKAARAIEARWGQAGREVDILRRDRLGDLNDAILEFSR
jgi:hypothetical protein